jgi:hypothetical protein
LLFNDNRILFLDNANIESSENIKLTMNPPTKAGGCFHRETEWEMLGAHASCFVNCDGKWRLYYSSKTDRGKQVLAVATSDDGVTWERPDVGVVEFGGSKKNNLVDVESESFGEFCIFVDPTAPDEGRFKMVCHQQAGGGMWALESSDGFNFKRIPGILLKFICDNNMNAFYDERIGKYVIYLRGWNRDRMIPPITGSRCVLRAETDDMHKPIPYDENAPDPWPLSPKWTDIIDGGLRRLNKELPMAMTCDELDPDEGGLYQGAVVHYLPEAYVGFPTLYFSYPPPPEGKYINDGLTDVQFAASRDGMKWQRDYRGSYVRLDLPDGRATQGMHLLTGMVPNGYRLNQYYSGGRYSHGYGRIKKDVNIGKREPAKLGDPIMERLEQRMDGFVSADSAYTGGMLVTKPFEITSDQLKLNIDTSASGVAHAALLDENGGAIPGFGLEECDRIQGNETQFVVTWKESGDLSKLKGKNVKLLLKSRSAKLYAIYR